MKKTDWKVRGTMLMVEPIDVGEKIGSIIVPDEARLKANTGIVIAVGGDADPAWIGSEVFFGSHDEYRVSLDDAGDAMVYLVDEKAVLMQRTQTAETFTISAPSTINVPPSARPVAAPATDPDGVPMDMGVDYAR